jgi:cytoskeletal protein CcmA (bactofilin family)
MFTRNSASDLMPPDDELGYDTAPRKPPSVSPPPSEPGKSVSEPGKSVISNDLKIIGQGLRIISRGTLQVDGDVEGEVGGAEIIVGEKGRVAGTVAAERVIVRGTVTGVIRAVMVALQSSARVEGDIHHMSLVIEQGAEFDGRCRRPADASELQLDLDAHG